MFIERLGFGQENPYNSLELSIHLSRYSLAEKFCQGLDVLDVACGEGYGSYVMANYWGAKSVKAVDISAEAIEIAQTNLASNNIEYFCYDAEEIDTLFQPNSFDIVISLETIEHINNPKKFLQAIKNVVKKDGIIIITCPNDHWYYGPGESGNPYHLHTYYFEEFKEVAEEVLGTANCYLLGFPLYGFGNFIYSDVIKAEEKMISGLLGLKPVKCSKVNPQESISANNCSYFVSIWGNIAGSDNIASAVIYPISMDTCQVHNTTLPEMYSHIDSLKNTIKSHETWSGDVQKRLEQFQSQLQHTQQQLEQSQSQLHQQKILNNQLHGEKEQLEFDYQQWRQIAQNNQTELEQSKAVITAMQSSKFWKLRTQWLKLKNFLGFSE
ncbi:MAG TPA: class I SAM-dependent methyltransferase [Leptolyngbyaceae cyanobacterium]